MRKNKILSLALAGALLVGGTFAGTRAYFTDQKTINNDYIISTAGMGIELQEGEWKVSRGDEAVEPGTAHVDGICNLKPGDVIEKTVKITNDSSIKQDVEVVIKGVNEDLQKNFIVDYNGLDKLNNLTAGDKEQTYTISVELSESMDNTQKWSAYNLNEIVGQIEINTEQTVSPK